MAIILILSIVSNGKNCLGEKATFYYHHHHHHHHQRRHHHHHHQRRHHQHRHISISNVWKNSPKNLGLSL